MQKKMLIILLILSLISIKPGFCDARVVGRAARDSSWFSSHPYWSNWVVAFVAVGVATAGLIWLAKDRHHHHD